MTMRQHSNNKSNFLNYHLPVQLMPFPVYPSLHEHVNDPSMLAHAAFAWQLSSLRVHSSLFKKKRNSWLKKFDFTFAHFEIFETLTNINYINNT